MPSHLLQSRCRLRPSRPDHRDYAAAERHPVLMRFSAALENSLPATVDCSALDSPVQDQGNLGSCGPHGLASLIEHYGRQFEGGYFPVARLFLYKVTRRLMGETGDCGVDARSLLKAAVLFGAPDESFWPYTDQAPDWDAEPTAFVYALAGNVKTLQYQRLDTPGLPPKTVLNNARKLLARRHVFGLGFTCYESLPSATADGEIPFPESGERVAGGHFVEVCGYDDARKVGRHTGALKIKNSWGTGWGARGYGWLPYQYLLAGQAWDLWAILKESWVDTKAFAAYEPGRNGSN